MDSGRKNNNLLYFSILVASGKQCFHKTGMEIYGLQEWLLHCKIYFVFFHFQLYS